jgi:dephospho-CoA kinase
VIESYPGVAQDLLHIPRKRNKKGDGYIPLLNGLKNFGIQDMKSDISHDEADAITSALVGYFYLADIYIGIGNEKEGYLIVPRLETRLDGQGFVVGLVGRIAAGKTTVAEYMRFKYGFDSMRFSQVISELYSVSGRDELQRIGQEIAKDSKKQKALSEHMISKMKAGRNYVIDGIRQAEDYDNLSNRLGNRFILVSVDAPPNTRAKRYIDAYPSTTKDKFLGIDSHPVERAIGSIENKRQYIIDNNKSYHAMRSQVDALIGKLS